MPNGPLGSMADQGYINPLSPAATKTVKANNVSVAAKGVEWNNKLYAYPFAEQAQTLYYNKSKLSDEEVKNGEGITAKGESANDLTKAKNYDPVFWADWTNVYGS